MVGLKKWFNSIAWVTFIPSDWNTLMFSGLWCDSKHNVEGGGAFSTILLTEPFLYPPPPISLKDSLTITEYQLLTSIIKLVSPCSAALSYIWPKIQYV